MAFGKTYKGIYKLKRPEKYVGNSDNVVYRSAWERAAFLWCEKNSNIVEWSSEEIIVPYYDPTKKRQRRYFIDLYFKMKDGTSFIIEIKPSSQLKPPKKGKRQSKKYIEEAMTYVTNQSKWKAATEFAELRGHKFLVWTEKELKKLGIIKW